MQYSIPPWSSYRQVSDLIHRLPLVKRKEEEEDEELQRKLNAKDESRWGISNQLM